MTDTKARTYPILFTFAQHCPLSTLVARGRGVAGLLAPETVLFAAPTQHLELRGLFACVSGESGVRVRGCACTFASACVNSRNGG